MYILGRSWQIGGTCASLLLAFALLPSHTIWAQGKNITLEDIWQNNTFAIKSVPGFNGLNDGMSYAQLDGEGKNQELNIYGLGDGNKKKNLIRGMYETWGSISDYAFSEDEKRVLVFTQPEPIYRRSIKYKVWSYDLEKGTTKEVANEKILHATFSPDGRQVAYVKDNDLYIVDLESGVTKAVTRDGAWNKVINGNCDWVYEEEFQFSRAYQWSPDGKHLAYYRFDESKVKEYTIPFYQTGQSYPTLYTYKYPKAGEDNSHIGIYIYDLRKGSSLPADIGPEKDQYIPRIKWASAPGQLCIYRLNRLQNKLELLLADANSGKTETIYQEENPYYIDINDNISFLPDGRSLILTSEKDGYNHIYHWDWKSKKTRQLTQGAWEVDALLGMDPSDRYIYYTAGKDSHLGRKLYKVDWKGGKSQCLTPQEGMHDIKPCKGFRYFLDKRSRMDSVPVYTLIDHQGKKVRVLEDNSSLQATMSNYALGKVDTFSIPNGRGETLKAWIIKPPQFDANKKYPVLLYQYSGPGSQEVLDKFPLGNYFWHQMLAQKGYIIVCADGTGTGGRGEAFKKKTYLKLGQLEGEDQITVGRFMAAQPYVDKERIGIWGWSFGGFISATCVLKGNEVFKAAISVAPVTNWRYYDNIYTERYMRKPQDNEKGYDDNAPERMASLLKGKLLVIHGTADDNVHFQNAVSLTEELIKANKQFESEYYPNKNHSIYGGTTRLQLYTRMTQFLLDNL